MEQKPKMERLLFVQHATEMSGSYRSLLLTIQGIKKRNPGIDICILCRSREIAQWYQKENIQAQYFPFIGRLTHCTISHGIYNECKQLLLMPFFVFAQFLLFFFHPYYRKFSIIHLNSSVLISSGIAASLTGKKIVWHIREIIAPGYFGIRKAISTKIIDALAAEILCISPLEKAPFPNDRPKIIYNFVSDEMFSQNEEEMAETKKLQEQFHIHPTKDYVFLHLGGSNEVKGGKYILELWKRFEEKGLTHLHLLWLGDDLQETFPDLDLKKYPRIHNLNIQWKAKPYLYLCDVVYFGALVAHFPRPLFEGFCAKKCALSFRVPMMEVFVADRQDGLLIDFFPDDFEKTIGSMETIIREYFGDPKDKNPEQEQKIKNFGLQGYEHKGEKYFRQEKSLLEFQKIYESLLVIDKNLRNGRI